MPPRKYCSYDPKSLENAVTAGEQYLPKRAATKGFGIPWSTLQDMQKGWFSLRSRLGKCTVFTTAEENDIVEWLKRMTRRGLPVKREDIGSSVQK